MNDKLRRLIFIRPSCVTIVCSVLLSLFVLVGYSFSKDYSFNWLFGADDGMVHVNIIARTILLFVLLSAVLERVINIVFYLILERERLAEKKRYKETLYGKTVYDKKGKTSKIIKENNFFDKHIFIISFLTFIVMWMPYYIAYFPGSVPADGLHMIKDAIGETPLSNHHSWVLALVLGRVFKLGSRINQNMGVFMAVRTLGVIEAICYAYVIKTMRKWNCKRALCIGMILFVAIMPGFGAYAQAYLKDGLFYAMNSVIVTIVMDTVKGEYSNVHKIRKSTDNSELSDKSDSCINDGFLVKMAAIVIVGIVLSLIRRDAMVRIVVGMIVLIILIPKRKKAYAAGALMLILNAFVIITMLADSISVEKGRSREPFSIPFQQTARYITNFPYDVSYEECKAISKVLDINVITRVYDPERSDSVKETFNENAIKEEIRDYFNVWRTQFGRHPRVYFEATISNSFAYIYPFYRYDGMRTYQTYMKEDALMGNVLQYGYQGEEGFRNIMDAYLENIRTFPITSLLFSAGTYTWLIILCQGYLIYTGRKREALLLLVVGFNVFIFIGSPVNGLFRYSMVVIACVPQILGLVFSQTKISKRTNKNNAVKSMSGKKVP